MTLADHDRRSVTWRYEAWDQDLVFRPISAKQLLVLQAEFGQVDGQAVDNLAAARFYAALLSASCISHAATVDEWLELRMDSLLTIGQQALRINGLAADDQAKKN